MLLLDLCQLCILNYTIFYRGVSGFATDCPCGVWCHGLTICLLYVTPLFGNLWRTSLRLWTHKRHPIPCPPAWVTGLIILNTAECHYSVVRHNMIYHKVWPFLRQNMHQWLHSQRHPISHLHRWAMGCLLWGFGWKSTKLYRQCSQGIMEITDHDITGPWF